MAGHLPGRAVQNGALTHRPQLWVAVLVAGRGARLAGSTSVTVRMWAADMLRQNQIWIAGDRLLRLPAWLIRTDPAAVVAQLRAALCTEPR